MLLVRPLSAGRWYYSYYDTYTTTSSSSTTTEYLKTILTCQS